jgi:hypothetical protein
MLRFPAIISSALLMLASSSFGAVAADFFAHRAHAYTSRVFSEPERFRGCPDRVSCYSLYGAYGPYGGRAYWSAYSPGAWGYYSALK